MGAYLEAGYISNIKINGISIKVIQCNPGRYTNIGGRTVDYIVMHYTGNPKDTAANNGKFFSSTKGQSSAHFFVDDDTVIQSVELRDRAWHCGTNGTYYHSKCRNTNSIGIEMCCSGDYAISQKTQENAAFLCAYLCKQLGITASTVDTFVLRHWDVTHKDCPHNFTGASNAKWTNFKKMVKNILTNGISTTPTPSNTTTQTTTNTTTGVLPRVVRINVDVLRVRSGPGTGWSVNTTVKKNYEYTIVEEKNGWGKLLSGAGWIFLEYTVSVEEEKQKEKKKDVTPAPVEEPFKNKLVRVIVESSPIYDNADESSKQNGTVVKGEAFTIVEIKNSFGKLFSDAGWIKMDATEDVK